MKFYSFFAALTLFVLSSGCAGIYGEQGRVAIIDSGSRTHLQADPTMADYMAFTERVTNKMLSSPVVQQWSSQPPRLIVGRLVNNTDDERIRVADIQSRIQEVLLNSAMARIVDDSATQFDYIIRSEMTSTRQYSNDGSELSHFTLTLKLHSIAGELLGQWSDDLTLAKSGRSLF